MTQLVSLKGNIKSVWSGLTSNIYVFFFLITIFVFVTRLVYAAGKALLPDMNALIELRETLFIII